MAKNGEGLGTCIMSMMSDRCGEVGRGGEERGAQLKYLPESEFVTGQAEYSLSCVNVWGLA